LKREAMASNWLRKIGKYLLNSFLGKPRRKRSVHRKGRRKKTRLRKRNRVRKKKVARSPKLEKQTRRPKRAPAKRKKGKKPSEKPVCGKTKRGKALPEEVYVGKITRYFPKVNACAVKVEKTEFKVGDRIHIRGATTDIKMKVRSLQISLIPVDSGRPGEEVGLEVNRRVRENDEVYLL